MRLEDASGNRPPLVREGGGDTTSRENISVTGCDISTADRRIYFMTNNGVC